MTPARLSRIITGLLIFFSTQTVWTQTSWTPYAGNPLLTGGTLDPSVIFDSVAQKYSLWFVTPAGAVREGSSSDGFAWTVADTPALLSGSAGSYDQLITSVSVVKSQGLYFMYYTAYGPSDSSTIGLATAIDGVHWKKHQNSPVLRPGGVATWEYPKVTGARVTVANGTFYMMYSGSNGTYQDAGLATSADGLTWVRCPANPLLVHGDPSSLDGRYLGAAGIAYRDGTFYLIYRATNLAGLSSYCLATSSNGVQWQKYSGNPIYAPSGYGWDASQIGGGSLLWAENRFKFWYCGTAGDTWSTGFAYLSLGNVQALRPVIDTAYVIPRTYYQIRMTWFRSVLDSSGSSDQVTQYSIWRLVPGSGTASSGSHPPADVAPSAALISPLWDFIQTVPAAGFGEYSTVITAYVDYTVPGTKNILMVAAHTKNLNVYFSEPDTVLVDPPAVTGVSGAGQRVTAYSLEQNYPNPFNPSTMISYSLPRASVTRLSVFNTLGQEVVLLVDAFQDVGVHEVRFDARGLASGVYVYRLSAAGFVQSRTLLLLR